MYTTNLQANPYSFPEQTYPTIVNDSAYDPANHSVQIYSIYKLDTSMKQL